MLFNQVNNTIFLEGESPALILVLFTRASAVQVARWYDSSAVQCLKAAA